MRVTKLRLIYASIIFFFFFKNKTSYEMRISDWSSDVCSSDLIGETVKTVQALDLAMAEFRFDESANTIYHFVWATFCDWYLELIKGQVDEETRTVAGWVLDQILVMLHPFMPFITEELWHAMSPRANDLILAHWPMADARSLDPEAGPEIDWLVRLVSE